MISINLLPEEFRVKKKRKSDGEQKPYLKLAAGGVVLFLIMTGYFYIDFLIASSRLKKVEKDWLAAQPQATELANLQKQVDTTLRPEKDFLASFVATGNPLTHILQWCSEFLPVSGWLSEVQLQRRGEGGDLLVKGYCLGNKEKSSIEQIETYLHELKTKMPDANLSLTTTRQKYEGVEITQFIANFVWEKQNGL